MKEWRETKIWMSMKMITSFLSCPTRHLKRNNINLARQLKTNLTTGLLMVTSMLMAWLNVFLITTPPHSLLKELLRTMMKTYLSTSNYHMIQTLLPTLKFGRAVSTLFLFMAPLNTLHLMQRISRIH